MDEYVRGEINFTEFLLQHGTYYSLYIIGISYFCIHVARYIKKHYDKWRKVKEDDEYHDRESTELARKEALQKAREKQQHLLEEASQQALEKQKQREENKRAENLERLERYQSGGKGKKLDSSESDYFPLNSGSSGSSYRPPKRKTCGGGGCGR